MSLASLTILRDRLSTTKTDTVLFFLILSYLLQIEHKAMLLYFIARWSKSSTSTCIFGRGAVQLFSFSFSSPFWGDDFPSFSGEGNFWDVFSFWSGGGAFLVLGDFFFFTGGEGHPC